MIFFLQQKSHSILILRQEAFTSDYLRLKHKRQVTFGSLTEKSRSHYSKCYAAFKEWAADNKAFLLSEDVFLAYFSYQATKLKTSTLWNRYFMLRVTVLKNDSVDISQFKKLKAFLKEHNECSSAKKSKVFLKSN